MGLLDLDDDLLTKVLTHLTPLPGTLVLAASGPPCPLVTAAGTCRRLRQLVYGCVARRVLVLQADLPEAPGNLLQHPELVASAARSVRALDLGWPTRPYIYEWQEPHMARIATGCNYLHRLNFLRGNESWQRTIWQRITSLDARGCAAADQLVMKACTESLQTLALSVGSANRGLYDPTRLSVLAKLTRLSALSLGVQGAAKDSWVRFESNVDARGSRCHTAAALHDAAERTR
jgi:hypothetical protein